MTEAPADLEDRQRVDRWLEESQYLLGRLIPGYLEDRERLNRSSIHVDFMLGSPDVDVTGIKRDGERLPVLREATWQL